MAGKEQESFYALSLVGVIFVVALVGVVAILATNQNGISVVRENGANTLGNSINTAGTTYNLIVPQIRNILVGSTSYTIQVVSATQSTATLKINNGVQFTLHVDESHTEQGMTLKLEKGKYLDEGVHYIDLWVAEGTPSACLEQQGAFCSNYDENPGTTEALTSYTCESGYCYRCKTGNHYDQAIGHCVSDTNTACTSVEGQFCSEYGTQGYEQVTSGANKCDNNYHCWRCMSGYHREGNACVEDGFVPLGSGEYGLCSNIGPGCTYPPTLYLMIDGKSVSISGLRDITSNGDNDVIVTIDVNGRGGEFQLFSGVPRSFAGVTFRVLSISDSPNKITLRVGSAIQSGGDYAYITVNEDIWHNGSTYTINVANGGPTQKNIGIFYNAAAMYSDELLIQPLSNSLQFTIPRDLDISQIQFPEQFSILVCKGEMGMYDRGGRVSPGCLYRDDELHWTLVAYSEIPETPPPPSCGDQSCNGIETCTTCPSDCGACQNTPPGNNPPGNNNPPNNNPPTPPTPPATSQVYYGGQDGQDWGSRTPISTVQQSCNVQNTCAHSNGCYSIGPRPESTNSWGCFDFTGGGAAMYLCSHLKDNQGSTSRGVDYCCRNIATPPAPGKWEWTREACSSGTGSQTPLSTDIYLGGTDGPNAGQRWNERTKTATPNGKMCDTTTTCGNNDWCWDKGIIAASDNNWGCFDFTGEGPALYLCSWQRDMKKMSEGSTSYCCRNIATGSNPAKWEWTTNIAGCSAYS